MSDAEIFSFNESGESYDPAAFERFKEKVKKNAKFVAALRKAEQKQKKQEDALLKILMQFFQKNQKQGILLLASRLLEQNIPASFVLAIIILGNEALKEEVSHAMIAQGFQKETLDSERPKPAQEFSLMAQFSDPSIPLKIKVDVDGWGKGLYEAASSQPYRLLETAIDRENNVKQIIIDCMANVLHDFLENNGMPNFSFDTAFSFCEFLAKGLLTRIKDEIENRKMVEN